MGVISIWLILKAVSLDDITQVMSRERDEKLKDPRVLFLRRQEDEEEPARRMGRRST